MKKTKVTAIFDIGKTNKKFFLFDENYQQVFKQYVCFEEIKDDDDFAADDLIAIQTWIKKVLNEAFKDERFEIASLNFSTYGASFIHVDERGLPAAPLYNYLKPYPENILQSFYDKYGDEIKIALETASPVSGMLNSGLQLYWLKCAKPHIFKKIKWSFHLPQYLAYLFSGMPVSEYTSIGCHTGLWDYNKNDYHDWVYTEEFDKILPPIVSADTIFKKNVEGKSLRIGSGIHDSSAALLPYMLSSEEPFLLISTGTWSISLNPFSKQILSEDDLQNNCLHYMRTDGKAVRASRLLLGSEYTFQTERLAHHFNKEKEVNNSVRFNDVLFKKWINDYASCFHFRYITNNGIENNATNYTVFKNYEEAYHRLMIELTALQAQSALRAIGDTKIKNIYIDGGFADNEFYIKISSSFSAICNLYNPITTGFCIGSCHDHVR